MFECEDDGVDCMVEQCDFVVGCVSEVQVDLCVDVDSFCVVSAVCDAEAGC